MKDWYKTFDESLWLHPDEVGAEEATFIRKALGLRKYQSVLDAPCGAGRIAIHLAHAGIEVFEKAGLIIENVYGSHAGEPYSRSSKRLIVVGRK